MPSHAIIHFEMPTAGLQKGCYLWMSFGLETPIGGRKHYLIPVVLDGPGPLGKPGDNATVAAARLSEGVKSQAPKAWDALIKVGTSIVGATSHGFVELDGVEEVDAACCDTSGSVLLEIRGNVEAKASDQVTPGGVVDIVPLRVYLDLKGECPGPGLEVPRDPVPKPGDLPAPPPPATPPAITPITPHPPRPYPPETTPNDPSPPAPGMGSAPPPAPGMSDSPAPGMGSAPPPAPGMGSSLCTGNE